MKNLYREQNLKRGDIILCDGQERIFITYIKGAIHPYVCVFIGYEDNFRRNKGFVTSDWKEENVSLPKEWYENIPENGVICWVSDIHEKAKYCVDSIWYKKNGRFHSRTNRWKYATPVKPEELYQGE